MVAMVPRMPPGLRLAGILWEMLSVSAWSRLIFWRATTLIISSLPSVTCSNQVQPRPMLTIWHSCSLFEVPGLIHALSYFTPCACHSHLANRLARHSERLLPDTDRPPGCNPARPPTCRTPRRTQWPVFPFSHPACHGP